MKIKKIITFPGIYLLFAFHCACNQITKEPTNAVTNRELNNIHDSTIYSFLKMVIAKEKISVYALVDNPCDRLDIILPDSIFLQKFLIDTSQWQLGTNDYARSSFSTRHVDKCLTSEDLIFMSAQKKESVNFKWDAARLNLTPTTAFGFQGTEYSFSIPLFSKDNKIALISFDSYSNGGRLFLFKKHNNEWSGKEISSWVH